MRILVVNYRYFVSGGAERYMFALKERLEDRGHEVIPFSIRYSQNLPSSYESYFVPPLAGADQVKFSEHRFSPRALATTLERSFYSTEVENAVRKLIRDTRPQVAYVLHFLKKLSPAVLVGIKRERLPIILRLSDLLLICPEAHLMREGNICTLCTEGSLWPSVKYKCVQGSRLASSVHFLATHYHKHRGYFDLIDRFVAPSEQTMEWMIRSGWPREKFRFLPTPVSDPFFQHSESPSHQPPRYLLYVGHLEAHKGIDTLLRAYATASRRTEEEFPKLYIAGALKSKFALFCMELADELSIRERVHFLGFVDGNGLPELYRNALLTVVPSRSYENLPNVLIESYASGTPVIGAGHGSIGPLIREGVTGATFRPGDAEDLADKLYRFARDREWCERAGSAARDLAEREHRIETHVGGLFKLFEEAQDTNS